MILEHWILFILNFKQTFSSSDVIQPKKPTSLSRNGFYPEPKKLPETKKHLINDIKKKNSPTTQKVPHQFPHGTKIRRAHSNQNKTPTEGLIMPTKVEPYRSAPQKAPISVPTKTKSLHQKLGISQNSNSSRMSNHHGNKHHMLGQGSGVQKVVKKQSPSLQLPSNNNKLPSNNNKFPSNNNKLPSNNIKLPSNNLVAKHNSHVVNHQEIKKEKLSLNSSSPHTGFFMIHLFIHKKYIEFKSYFLLLVTFL